MNADKFSIQRIDFYVYSTNFCHCCSSILQMKTQMLTASSDDLSKSNRVIIASPQATENKILPAIFFNDLDCRVFFNESS